MPHSDLVTRALALGSTLTLLWLCPSLGQRILGVKGTDPLEPMSLYSGYPGHQNLLPKYSGTGLFSRLDFLVVGHQMALM